MGKRRPLLSALMAAVGVAALYRAVIKPWMYTWGADDDEVRATLRGDELVRADAPRTTRALTIDAPRASVWPWLAQIGEDRGGFYSYWRLERAVGARVTNAEDIHPEWQDVQVGDTVWLARRYGDAARQVVAAVEPNKYLVLVSSDDYDRVRRGEKAFGAWAFHLDGEDGWTRFLVRGSGGAVGHALFDIPQFVMEQKMMRGIRVRAQHAHRERVISVLAARGAPANA